MGGMVARAGALAALVAISVGGLAGSVGSSTFPGGNGKIAFVVETETGEDQIWVMEPDGSGQTQLTDPAPGSDRDPSWSADGTRIVFAREVSDDPIVDIWVMDADGSGQTPLTTNGSGTLVSDPTFSPDGTRIAFGRFAGGGNEIWVMDADGQNQQLLTAGIQPNWSPDGSTITFTRDTGVWVIPADGSGAAQDLGGGAAESPCWSPDGSTIVFSTRSIPADIWAMNADGSDLRNLTEGNGANDALPCFSPDGARITFTSDRDNAPFFQIWVMNADGSDPQALTSVSPGAESSNWQPIPLPPPAPPAPIELVPTFTG